MARNLATVARLLAVDSCRPSVGNAVVVRRSNPSGPTTELERAGAARWETDSRYRFASRAVSRLRDGAEALDSAVRTLGLFRLVLDEPAPPGRTGA
jgi:hypothetical protein